VTQAPSGGTPPATPQLSSTLTTCQMLPQKLRMLTPQQIDDPLSMGRELLPNGHAVGCAVRRLWVPKPNGGAPDWPGQVILVSVTQQWLWAYQDGKLVFATPVTTGMPWLWTPLGVYHITSKVEDTVFYSPWPPSSPFYYTPEHVDYALFFRQKGFYIHDAPWRQAFGPGTEVPHTDPDGTYETGSHGCVNMTYGAGKWLYNWTMLGATVDIMAN
jgi:L,D-transpeptidase catalytic domain